jgi:hypothetical protein
MRGRGRQATDDRRWTEDQDRYFLSCPWSLVLGPWSVVSLLLLLLVLAPGVAGVPSTYAQSGGQAGLVVEAQTADAQFPLSVEFTLKARGFETTRAELNYRLLGEPITAGIQAEVERPTSELDLELSLDLATHYIPPGTQVIYYWALTGEGQETVYTPEKTFSMRDENYRWQSLVDEKNRVSVHWYDGDRDFGRMLVDAASNALDRLERDIDAGLERPAAVWVYASQDDLLDALPQNIPEWVGGKAFPELALVLAAIANDEYADQEIKRVVPHELSHLVLYQATRNPYNSPPAWMDEGLAVYNQEAHDPAEEEALRSAAEGGYLPPLKALSGSFGASEDTALLSYAQSASVIDFLLNDGRYGPEKFARTVAAFREGVTYDEALEVGIGATMDEIDQEWRASLPYEVAQPGSAPPANPGAGGSGSANYLVFDTTMLLVAGLSIVGVLFLVGAVLTAVALARRRT